jgi:hypothetical protein
MFHRAGHPHQGKPHAGFVPEFIECPQFVVPVVELVKVDVSPWNDFIFQCFQNADCGGIQISIQIDDEHFMGRAFILWQSFVEPSLEKLNSVVVNLRNRPIRGKMTLLTMIDPVFWQSFKAVEPVELAIWVEQKFGPVPRCIALKHAELQIQNFAIAYLFPDEIKQFRSTRKSPTYVVPFRPHPSAHFQTIDAPV